MLRIRTLIILLLLSYWSFGQRGEFIGNEVKFVENPALDSQFEDYTVYELDIPSIDEFVSGGEDEYFLRLQFGNDILWRIQLFPHDIRSNNYEVVVQSEKIRKVMPVRESMTYRGYLMNQGGGIVSLTINDHHFAGTVQLDGELFFIEPVHYFDKNAARNLVVVYAESDVIPNDNATCGADEMQKRMDDMEQSNHESGGSRMAECYEVELAIASDYLMYLDYNQNVNDVEDHNITVMNNVANNWDNEFADEIQFIIVTQFVSDCSTCDPWTNSTSANSLLSSFRGWGNSGGFGIPFDLGQLWTDRDLNGGTVGIAYINGVCNNNKYHVLQDFTTNANFLRVLTSHEIGHNFNAYHDAPNSGFIMTPVINNTNTWSGASISAINAKIAQQANSCFAECGSNQPPPVADFTSDVTSGCIPLIVNFTDLSSNGPTEWEWTFPGGTPASSTEQNPSVTYSTSGNYDVTLTATNGGGSATITQTLYISVNDGPVTSFDYDIFEKIVTFINTTSGGVSWYWDFGDGNTSTLFSPTHTYLDDGTYTVTLEATNECGTTTTTQIITILTLPVADFTSDVQEGCTPLVVNFIDQSSPNSDFWLWTMPGASPDVSTDQNPTVVYDEAGTYDVTLEVINDAGSNSITFFDFIIVHPQPIAVYVYTVTGLTVDFTNNSENADSYLWDFGDGNTSTEENPSHTYDEGGEYDVVLTATSDLCGDITFTQTITVNGAPVAEFNADVQEGCAPLTVQFTDVSSANPDSWDWTFEGGNPATSTEQNPTVTYDNAGTYDVTLIVSNETGADTITLIDYITVATIPDAGFTSDVNGVDVDFTNTSNNADSYSWDFGDGESSTEENPSHTYSADGEYIVELTATNECGSVTITETITIVTPPTAGFSSDVTSGCATLTVEFTDQSSSNSTSWEWTFEGGNPATSTEQNPTVTYDNAGTYDVTLTVTNAAGESTIIEVGYIVVTTVPDASFTSDVNGADVDFTNTTNNADSYSWDFGDGENSTEENPSHTYSADGEYIVELTATNDCGSVTITETITIGTPPTAGFSSDVTSGCATLTVEFTDQSSSNSTSWEWTFEGGNPATSTEQNPTVVYDNAGTYDVTLTVTNAAGESTVIEVGYIVVATVPDASFTSDMNGADVDFTNTTNNADSYSWDFGDGDSSTQENPSHTYDEDGEYIVELTATNDCGSVTVLDTINIVTPPTAGFSSDVTSGCATLTVAFTDQSSSNSTSWEWTFEGGNPATSTEQNPTVTYDNAGTYDVTLTVTNTAGESTVTEVGYVVVSNVPDAGFTSDVNGTSVDFLNTSTNATSYLWDFGDGEESADTNPTHEYEEDGEYTVVLTATNDCGSETFTEVITITTEPLAGFSANVTVGCASLTVQFMDESSGNTTSWEWTFEGGNPSSSTEQNPVVVYDSPGSYDVTLIASTSAGSDTYTQTEFIIVNTVPTVDFSSTINGATVNFLNNSTGATEYLWDFGDNTTSTDPNPEHTYDETGDYTVTLTATNECGSVTTTQTVSIVAAPVAAFSAEVTVGCAPFTVHFVDESLNAASWSWSFPGGMPSSSTEQNPIVIYNIPGNYSVVLEVSNTAGTNTLTITEYISVEDIPQPSFTSNVTGSIGIFTNTSNGGTSFEWDFGDGESSTEENPMHVYDEDGEYTVTLTVTNSCGSVSTSEDIIIATPPNANFSVDVTEGCAPFTVQFDDQSSSNTVSWQWAFPGGTPSSSTDQNPVVVYNSAGTYDVTLTVSNPAGSDESVQLSYIIVSDVPQADFATNINGTTAIFTNNSTNGGDYDWDFGDGESSTEANPEHEYQNVGDFEVQLIVTNECGADTITQTISIEGLAPTAAFSSDGQSGCAPFTVNFTDESTENPSSWDWIFEGGNPSNSTDQNPTVVYETAGTYEVSLTASNAFGENTVTEVSYITVLTTPVASFDYDDQNGTVIFNNTTTGGTSYDWNFGDGSPSSNEESPTHNYTATGEYNVLLTVTNECGSTTFEMIIQVIITGIEDFENIDIFNVFPNPNDGNFTLILEGYGTDDLKLEIYNILGQSIFNELIDFSNGHFEKEYSFQNTAAGTYILQIKSGKKVMYKKFLIER